MHGHRLTILISMVSPVGMMLLVQIPATQKGFVDLILVRGRIWTEDDRQPDAEAVVILGNRIVAVGSTAAVSGMAGPETRVIDLAGKAVLPGFNDAHVHFWVVGEGLSGVKLRDAKSAQELRRRIAEFAKTQPKGEWILNGEWDHERWTPVELPTHQLVDDVTPHNPVFVIRSDCHKGLANALAMKLAGLDRSTEDIPGGAIVRDTDGNPTGIFKDAAKDLIARAIPPPFEEHIIASVQAAQNHATERGVTSVQDMGVLGRNAADMMARILCVYQALHHRSELNVRISAHFPLSAWESLSAFCVRARFGDHKLRIGPSKTFADGSLGSTTAWFYEPNTDSPATCGIPSDELLNADQMYARMCGADEAGLQLSAHVIGDRANHTILDLFERLQREHLARDRRLRTEHAQHLLPTDVSRFAALNVIASVQPYHCIDDGRWASERVGALRAATTYPFRSLLDGGATLAFGSDWWLAPMDPLMGIYVAVTRRTVGGRHAGGWVPEQKISVPEAVHAYTVGSAYAEGEEKSKGSIEPGKLADLVVLSADIFQIDPVEIQNTKVDMTIVDGKVVFERS